RDLDGRHAQDHQLRLALRSGRLPDRRADDEALHGQVSSPSTASPAVALKDVRFAYRAGRDVLDIPALSIARGEHLFLHGPSGSGKTTLLGLLAGVLVPSAGRVEILGSDLGTMKSGARDHFRAEHLGYVFQMFNLIPYLSVRDNIT